MPTQKTRNLKPSVVVTSTLQAIMVCHFFIIEHILSRVKLIPWKLVRQCLPWTSSQMSLNFLKVVSSWWRSAWLHSKTRPLRPSEAILVPTVLETKVFPTWRQLNVLGALTSYQSFLVKGSIIFFLPPFLPLASLLFFPTAIISSVFQKVLLLKKCSIECLEM